jgi:PAS domain S-box-containing protein
MGALDDAGAAGAADDRPRERLDPTSAVIDSIPYPVSVWTSISNEAGEIVDFECVASNRRAEGYVADRLGDGGVMVGRRYLQVFDDEVGRRVFPRLCQVVSTGESDLFEAEAQRFPGLWFENLAARHGDGFVNLMRDISERRSMTVALEESERRMQLAERSAKESERQYRLLADHAGDVVISVRHGLVEWAAPSLGRLLGWTLEDVIGSDSMDFVHPDDVLAVDETTWTARHSSRLRVRLLRKDGEWLWADLIGRIAGPDDEPAHPLVITIIDAQAEMEARDALERAVAERQRLDERIRESARLESLSQLAGGIAHDFNNLLVGVLGNAEIALQDLPPNSPVRSRLVSLSAAAQRAAELTRQLLDFTGRQPRERITLDLSTVIADTVDLVQSMISGEVRITIAADSITRGVLGDRSQLQQVVMNLLMNASQAFDQFPGDVQVATRAVTLEAGAPDLGLGPGEHVTLEVSDNGRGIDAEHQRRIFDPFFSTRTEGRGLGLAVVSGIVRAHHGAVQVHSQVGQGTTFTVWLPAVDGPAPGTASRSSFRLHRQPTVMVVDDDEQVRDVTGDILRRAGLQVLSVARGSEAIKLFASRHANIDCVLLDLSMPDLTGDEVMVVLRAVDPSIPIVIMSGYIANDPLRSAMNQKATGFVQKPFLPNELVATVRGSLRHTPFD